MVALGSNGVVSARGTYKEVLVEDTELAQEAQQEEQVLAAADRVEVEGREDPGALPMKIDGKLIVEEEVAEGHVSLRASEFLAA